MHYVQLSLHGCVVYQYDNYFDIHSLRLYVRWRCSVFDVSLDSSLLFTVQLIFMLIVRTLPFLIGFVSLQFIAETASMLSAVAELNLEVVRK